ncbi:MAG: hypothetical protein U0989_00855 [Azonexus sp.]|nr:hypothetical protein [Azonexus sp.]MDZ4313319.1 hypothetical protein [Azonexus sp.]
MNRGMFLKALPLLAAMLGGPAIASEKITIVGTLARPAKLFEAPDATSRVLDSWPANSSFESAPKSVIKVQDSFVQVEHNGASAWVLIRSIRANRQIRVAENCGAMPVDNMPRSAATRGVGEPCK